MSSGWLHFIMLNTLSGLSRNHRDNPVVLCLVQLIFRRRLPCRYLGYTLVEGVWRSRRVYLKTLGGLLSVDVIMRRMGDGRCDPLAPRPDSPGGIRA